MVARLISRPVDEVFAALRRARNVQLVSEWFPANPYMVAFRHTVYSDVLCGELMAAEAAELHARIASELEARTDRNYDAEIALHWSAAGNVDKALTFSLRAADHAFSIAAYADAAALYEDALRFTTQSDDQHTAILEKRALAHYASGVSERIRPAFEQALMRYEHLGQPGKAAEMLLYLSRQAWNDAETAEGYAFAMRAAGLKGVRDKRLREQAAIMAASYAVHLGRTREALRLIRSVSENASNEVLSRRDDVQSIASARLGKPRAAIKASDLALSRAEQSGDPDLIVRVNSNRADILFAYGRYTDTVQAWRTCYEQAMRAGYVGRLAYGALGYSAQVLLQGDLQLANTLLRTGVETAVSNATIRMLGPAVAGLLKSLTGLRDIPDLFDASEALALAIQSKESARIGQVAGLLASALILEGKPEQADEVIEKALLELGDPHFSELLLSVGAASLKKSVRERSRQFLRDLACEPGNLTAKEFLAVVEGAGNGVPADQGYLSHMPVVGAVLALRSGNVSLAQSLLERIKASSALARLFKKNGSRTTPGTAPRLTPRQLQVAKLVASEFSNRSIAKSLAISERTVEHHVDSILSELGLRSRWLINSDVLASLENGKKTA